MELRAESPRLIELSPAEEKVLISLSKGEWLRPKDLSNKWNDKHNRQMAEACRDLYDQKIRFGDKKREYPSRLLMRKGYAGGIQQTRYKYRLATPILARLIDGHFNLKNITDITPDYIEVALKIFFKEHPFSPENKTDGRLEELFSYYFMAIFNLTKRYDITPELVEKYSENRDFKKMAAEAKKYKKFDYNQPPRIMKYTPPKT